jgi:hypothetical protein
MSEPLEILDVIDGIVDDSHPEGDGCPLCEALDELRDALSVAPHPGTPHEFRTTCRLCGQSGYLNLSIVTDSELVRIEPRPAALPDTGVTE